MSHLPFTRPPHERGRPRQHVVDRRCVLREPRRRRHPVADGRIAALAGVVRQPAGDLGAQLAVIGDEAIEASLLDDDAPGNQVTPREGREVLPELLAPAIVFDQWIGP